jgi:hypothetical protein
MDRSIGIQAALDSLGLADGVGQDHHRRRIRDPPCAGTQAAPSGARGPVHLDHRAERRRVLYSRLLDKPTTG